ncbi:MAG: hypothetical protein WBW60_03690, partial [Candidatus Sulfotelmatobacter sp.]
AFPRSVAPQTSAVPPELLSRLGSSSLQLVTYRRSAHSRGIGSSLRGGWSAIRKGSEIRLPN